MNEELTLAIEELRQRPADQSWFIPVLLNECEVPKRRIGASESLQSIQYVCLYENWEKGIEQILSVIQSASLEVRNQDIWEISPFKFASLLKRIAENGGAHVLVSKYDDYDEVFIMECRESTLTDETVVKIKEAVKNISKKIYVSDGEKLR